MQIWPGHRSRPAARVSRISWVLVALLALLGWTNSTPAVAQREPGTMLPPRVCQDPPHPYSCVPPRPFLAFSFAAGDIWTRPDRADFFKILQLHYNTAPTQASTSGYIAAWHNYRREVLAANPDAILGIYFSAISTQNPTQRSAYDYPSDNFVGPDFLCDNPQFAEQFDPRPDEFGFYSPRTILERSNWEPWRQGLFGRWPFYEFKARGWVLPQTTYLCRPVINFANPACVAFVIDRLQRAIVLDHSYVNAITFDNAAMITGDYGRWPGFGARGSWYRTRPPDQDFLTYLDRVRAGLHEVNARLIVNTGHLQELAPHTDVVFFESGVRRSMPTDEIRELISEFRAVQDAGTVLVQRYYAPYPNLPLEAAPDDLRFFLASSMLVYEPGTFAVDLQPPPDNFRFYPEYFMLPSWLGEAVGPYEEIAAGVFVRNFTNGVVMLNATDRRFVFSGEQYTTLGLLQKRAPLALTARSSIIKVMDCMGVTSHGSCPSLYQNQPLVPPIRPGDLNCDDVISLADHTPYLRAMLDPAAYAAEFPYCDRMAADMNQDGVIDNADYDIFFVLLFHNGLPPEPSQPGDLNCDGYVDNLDIDPFLSAILDANAYAAHWPDCSPALADIDSDGTATYFDIPPFLDLLLGPGSH